MKKPLPKPESGRVLTDWVYRSVREAITEGYFEPGEKLDQDLVADELEVSRTPVREALKALESEGFVEIRPHRGVYIPKLSPQDIRFVYEIRILLETDAVRRAIPRIPDSVLAEMEELLKETKKQFEAGDRTAILKGDHRFHSTIVDNVENDLFREILESLAHRISQVRRVALVQPGPHLVESQNEHYDILRAMRQRDSETATEAMQTHLMNSAIRMVDVLDRSSPSNSH